MLKKYQASRPQEKYQAGNANISNWFGQEVLKGGISALLVVKIEGNEKEVNSTEVEIQNAKGQQIFTTAEHLLPGNYRVTVTFPNGKKQSRRITLQNNNLRWMKFYSTVTDDKNDPRSQ